MIKKDLIKELIRDFQTRNLPKVNKRLVSLPFNPGKIVSITGVRRSGKTFLMYDLISDLTSKNIKKENIVYINFEDERLDMDLADLDLIIQSYRELFPTIDLKNVYFFFDEIQNIQNWEKFVRRIDDSASQNIYITGSNAHFLSSEIATTLRGRSINYEVFPLTFKEYLDFLTIPYDLHDPTNKAKISNCFKNFLLEGGFPETVPLAKEIKTKTLQEYFDVMLYRDMVERYHITNLPVLKYFIKRIFESITKPLSINKIYNELKSQGYKIGKNLLYDFIDEAESVYLALSLRKYSNSILKRELSEKKYYCIDNGLLNAITYYFTNDYGKLLENLIFLELKKGGKDISFLKNIKECDFLITEKEEIKSIIQVSYSLADHETKKREIEALCYVCKSLKKEEGLILTFDEQDIIIKNGIKISIMPAYKYLLENLER